MDFSENIGNVAGSKKSFGQFFQANCSNLRLKQSERQESDGNFEIN